MADFAELVESREQGAGRGRHRDRRRPAAERRRSSRRPSSAASGAGSGCRGSTDRARGSGGSPSTRPSRWPAGPRPRPGCCSGSGRCPARPAAVVGDPLAALDDEGVWAAVRALPKEQAAAIALRYGADLGVEDVADALGSTVPAVKSLLHRGRTALRSSPVMQAYAE